MSKNFKEIIRKLLMLVAVIAIIYSSYQLLHIKDEENTSKVVNKEVVEIVGQHDDGNTDFLTRETYNKLLNINPDFKGYLYYPSLEINEQVVQTINNEYYLTHSFYREYSPYGTVFIDYNQNIDQQNTTLYGHWVSKSTLKFSNLHKLKDEANYDKYKTFYYTDDKFIYEFQVGIVIYHHSIDDYDNIPYWQGEFTNQQFTSFINNAKNQAFYNTGVDFEADDNVMTLQTCITVDSDQRLVVIGKEISREPLKDK